MNNTPALLRSLIIFVVIVPLAIFVGYTLTNPLDYSTFALFGVLALALTFPLLLRWHYSLLLLSWGASAVAFFMKGSPSVWLVMVVLSLGISMLERILNPEMKFIRVPQLTWPLICMCGVVFFTAKMTGGFGLRAFGSDVYGGKKYVFLLIGIVSYFAITARPIPPDKVKWFVALFFLGGTTKIIGDFYPITPSFLHFVYWVFPPNTGYYGGSFQVGTTRLGGVGWASVSACFWMLAQYGIRGIFLTHKRWRIVLFTVFFALIFLGGFRSAVFQVMAAFVLLFFLEGMYRTQLLPVFAFIGIIAVVVLVPLAPHLPFTVQRSLAFLPLDLSHEAKAAAEDSSNWRFEMWKALLPKIPQHLLLGKGYAISMEDYEFMGNDTAFHAVDAGQQGLALSGDYHNGVLSVILPFGIWGLIVYVWFMTAGLWVVYCNWRYGDPALRSVNAMLFVLSLIEFSCFASCISGYALSGGIGYWAGNVGLSIALNHGVCRERSQVSALSPDQTRQSSGLTKPFPRPRPVFQRYRTGL